MPTILLVNGFRFFFYSADGDEPIHVHVQKGMETEKYGFSLKLKLNTWWISKQRKKSKSWN